MAIALFLGVFIAHDSANWIAPRVGIYPWAVFFMLQGTWTVVLSVCLGLFIWGAIPSFERTLALVAIAIAITEGLQIPLCGMGVADFAKIPEGVNVCDHVTGLPITAVVITLELCIATYYLIRPYLRG